MASWFVCKPCAGSDPTQDTVKVNIKELDKENVQPAQLTTKSDPTVLEANEKKLAECRRKQAEDEAKRRKEEAAAAEAQLLREQMKKAAEMLAEAKTKREAEERALQAVEKAQREAAEEAQRVHQVQQAAEEQAKQEEAVKLAAEVATAQEKVNAWCKQNSYRDMNIQKKTMRGATKFPLHTAVKHKNEMMVRDLVRCGADQGVGSKQQTPKELAATLNKNRSHDEILALLH